MDSSNNNFKSFDDQNTELPEGFGWEDMKEGVYAKMPPKKKQRRRLAAWWWFGAAGILVLAFGTWMLFDLNTTGDATTVLVKAEATEEIAASTSPATPRTDEEALRSGEKFEIRDPKSAVPAEEIATSANLVTSRTDEDTLPSDEESEIRDPKSDAPTEEIASSASFAAPRNDEGTLVNNEQSDIRVPKTQVSADNIAASARAAASRNDEGALVNNEQSDIRDSKSYVPTEEIATSASSAAPRNDETTLREDSFLRGKANSDSNYVDRTIPIIDAKTGYLPPSKDSSLATYESPLVSLEKAKGFRFPHLSLKNLLQAKYPEQAGMSIMLEEAIWVTTNSISVINAPYTSAWHARGLDLGFQRQFENRLGFSIHYSQGSLKQEFSFSETDTISGRGEVGRDINYVNSVDGTLLTSSETTEGVRLERQRDILSYNTFYFHRLSIFGHFVQPIGARNGLDFGIGGGLQYLSSAKGIRLDDNRELINLNDTYASSNPFSGTLDGRIRFLHNFKPRLGGTFGISYSHTLQRKVPSAISYQVGLRYRF